MICFLSCLVVLVRVGCFKLYGLAVPGWLISGKGKSPLYAESPQ